MENRDVANAKQTILSFLNEIKQISIINDETIKQFNNYTSLNNQQLKNYFKYYFSTNYFQVSEIKINRLDLLDEEGDFLVFALNATYIGSENANKKLNGSISSKFTLKKEGSNFIISKIEKNLSGHTIKRNEE